MLIFGYKYNMQVNTIFHSCKKEARLRRAWLRAISVALLLSFAFNICLSSGNFVNNIKSVNNFIPKVFSVFVSTHSPVSVVNNIMKDIFNGKKSLASSSKQNKKNNEQSDKKNVPQTVINLSAAENNKSFKQGGTGNFHAKIPALYPQNENILSSAAKDRAMPVAVLLLLLMYLSLLYRDRWAGKTTYISFFKHAASR
jgi:hypothetical protein